MRGGTGLKTEILEEAKAGILSIAEDLSQRGYLGEDMVKHLKEELNTTTLNIAVVGQMKYGKSTFLNALLFGKPLLPTSDTPMTAALTAIEYGDKGCVVEFMTEDEVEDLLKLAKDLEEQKKPDRALSNFKANYYKAKEEMKKLLGTKKEIFYEELPDYVGADGKYTPITKMVTIKIPHEGLKGVRVVDTPGFNDPIKSRSERAEKFLSEADIVIVFLYAERPFDANDKELIFQKILSCGAGKLVIVLNKIDTILDQRGELDKVNEYVKEALEKSIDEIESETTRKIFKEAPYFAISALWALLGRMEEEEIKRDKDLSWYYEKFLESGEYPFLRTKYDLLKHSQILRLEEHLNQIIKEDKAKILINKIKGKILGVLKDKKSNLNSKRLGLLSERRLLDKNKEEIERRNKEFEDFIENEYPKIMSFSKISDKIDKIITESRYEFLKLIEKTYKDIIDSIGKPGLIDLGGYAGKVNRIMGEKLIGMKYEAEKKLNEIFEEAKDAFISWFEDTSDKLLEAGVVKKYTNYSLKAYQEIIQGTRARFDELSLLDISPKRQEMKMRVWIGAFGRVDNVYNKAQEVVDKNCRNFYKILNKLLKNIRSFLVEDRHREDILREKIIRPIEDSLKKAKEAIERKEERIQEIEKELKKLEEQIAELDRVIKKTENRFANLEV